MKSVVFSLLAGVLLLPLIRHSLTSSVNHPQAGGNHEAQCTKPVSMTELVQRLFEVPRQQTAQNEGTDNTADPMAATPPPHGMLMPFGTDKSMVTKPSEWEIDIEGQSMRFRTERNPSRSFRFDQVPPTIDKIRAQQEQQRQDEFAAATPLATME